MSDELNPNPNPSADDSQVIEPVKTENVPSEKDTQNKADGFFGKGEGEGEKKADGKADGTGKDPKDDTKADGDKTKQADGEGSKTKAGDDKKAKADADTKSADKTDNNEGNKKDYSLKVEPDSIVSKKDVDGIEAFAKEKGYTQEEAQKVLDFQVQLTNDSLANIQARLDAQAKALKDDPEIGGEYFKETQELVEHAIDDLLSPKDAKEFRKEMDDTASRNSYFLNKLLRGAAIKSVMLKSFEEGKPINSANTPMSMEQRADNFYGKKEAQH